MGRNTRSCRTGYFIRALLYPSSVDDENERIVKREFIKPIIFYAKDHAAFELIRNEFGGIVQRQLIGGYIETMDLAAGQIKIFDTVEYDGRRYNVENVRIESSNKQIEVTRRPDVKTIIKLGALE